MTKERTVQGLTGKLAVLEMGAAEGRPILAIHGWLDNAASFIPLAENLSQYRWICVDLPGHGKSEARPDGSIYHFTDYVADIYRAVEFLQLGSCNVIGHSLGASVAATFAASFPEKIDRVILIDGIGPISGKDDDTLDQLRKSMKHLTQPVKEGPREYSSWEALVKKRLDAGKIERHSVEMLLSRGAERHGDAVTVLSDSRLKQHSPIYMSQKKVLSILGGIKAETLLILANEGLAINRETTQQRIDAFSSLTTAVLAGAHHLHLDDPQPVADEIRRFLETGTSE